MHPLVRELERKRILSGISKAQLMRVAGLGRDTLHRWTGLDITPNVASLDKANAAIDVILKQRAESC